MSFIQRCCTHVADAIDANTPEHANLVLDGAHSAVMVCDACIPDSREEAALYTEEWTIVKVVLECGEHATIWFARTGNGDLLEAIHALTGRR